MPNHLSAKQRAAILAALRFWQATPSDDTEDYNEIATDCGAFDALSIEEIDALCEQINEVQP
jgi:hypothetical protein